jgi:hypothetical protein
MVGSVLKLQRVVNASARGLRFQRRTNVKLSGLYVDGIVNGRRETSCHTLHAMVNLYANFLTCGILATAVVARKLSGIRLAMAVVGSVTGVVQFSPDGGLPMTSSACFYKIGCERWVQRCWIYPKAPVQDPSTHCFYS